MCCQHFDSSWADPVPRYARRFRPLQCVRRDVLAFDADFVKIFNQEPLPIYRNVASLVEFRWINKGLLNHQYEKEYFSPLDHELCNSRYCYPEKVFTAYRSLITGMIFCDIYHCSRCFDLGLRMLSPMPEGKHPAIEHRDQTESRMSTARSWGLTFYKSYSFDGSKGSYGIKKHVLGKSGLEETKRLYLCFTPNIGNIIWGKWIFSKDFSNKSIVMKRGEKKLSLKRKDKKTSKFGKQKFRATKTFAKVPKLKSKIPSNSKPLRIKNKNKEHCN